MASNRTSQLPPGEHLRAHLSPLILPTISTSVTNKKLMRHKRSREQQKTLNEIIMKEALKAYEEIVSENKRRVPTPPEPQLPSTIYYLYIKKCVESSPVVPIQKHWLSSMLSLVPQSLQKGKDREVLIQDLLEEVSQDFEKSMKRHLVKSILVRPEVKGLESEDSDLLPEDLTGLDYSKPWHQSFVQAKNEIQKNLHPLHPALRTMLELGYSTFSSLLIADLSGYRSKGPVECESLKNSVSLACAKTEEKLMNIWYPKVINLFTSKEALQLIKPDKIDSFYSCVTTLMSNQIKDLLLRTVEAFVKLFDPEDPQYLPLFKMQLTFDDERMDFYPSFQDLEEAILFIVTRVSKTLQNVQTVQSWLSGSNTVQIIEAKLSDYIINSAVLKLKEAIRHNLKEPMIHFQTYVESYSWLVDGSAVEKVQTFLTEEHSFDEYTVVCLKK